MYEAICNSDTVIQKTGWVCLVKKKNNPLTLSHNSGPVIFGSVLFFISTSRLTYRRQSTPQEDKFCKFATIEWNTIGQSKISYSNSALSETHCEILLEYHTTTWRCPGMGCEIGQAPTQCHITSQHCWCTLYRSTWVGVRRGCGTWVRVKRGCVLNVGVRGLVWYLRES